MSSNISNRAFFPEKAAVDITTGYAADSFLGETRTRVPWDKHCFMSIVDAATNHREFFYPLPTTLSAEAADLNKLPLAIVSLHKARVLTPITQTTAEQLEVTDEVLTAEYKNFQTWAMTHDKLLKDWLILFGQKEIKKQHLARVRKDVQDFTTVFWNQNTEARVLARKIGVKPNELRYAFDVMFRGLQYYQILSPNEVIYFPHPIRHPLLRGQASAHHEEYAGKWSWGRLLANLVEADRIRKEPEEIAQVIASLRVRIGSKEGTWYDLSSKPEKERKDILTTIAGESSLPANIKDGVRKAIEIGWGITALATGLLPWPPPLVSIALSIVAIPLTFWKGEMPGAIGQAKFCRGLLEWPGLFDDK